VPSTEPKPAPAAARATAGGHTAPAATGLLTVLCTFTVLTFTGLLTVLEDEVTLLRRDN
jgi:hypothetical protein